MKELINSPLFGVLISLAAFEFGLLIYKKTKLPIFNPLLISIALIIPFLFKFGISYEEFNSGGQLISFFLGPATIVLALPLYKKLALLKKNALPILAGIFTGSVAGMLSIILLSRLFGLSPQLAATLLPKSITTPIGIEVSKQLGGLPSITVIVIIVTGIIGSIIGPPILKLCKITDKVASGIAIGTSSHAIGTSKALEMGETEGAMSGLSIGIAGVITVFVAPVIWKISQLF